MNKNEKLAYLAGIIDGEGCFGMHYYKKLNRHYLTVDIYNSCTELLEWLSGNFPGSHHEIKSASKKIHINWKPQYIWRSNNSQTLQFLKDLLPYLIVKKKQCELSIKFRETFIKRECPVSPETREIRRLLYEEIKSLNTRGIIIVPPCLPSV
jgi:hypothetical protein